MKTQWFYYAPDPEDTGSDSSDNVEDSSAEVPADDTESETTNTSSDEGGSESDTSTDTDVSEDENGENGDREGEDTQSEIGVSTDIEGLKLLGFGTWNGSANLKFQGGQIMRFEVKNLNVLGTTITIDSNIGGSKSMIIAPFTTVEMRFSVFGREPMSWTFSVSSNSDAFIVGWKLYSSWVPGDPPNG